MAKGFRYSKKRLETMASNINNLTNHKVTLVFGVGCYVFIDGKEHSHYIKKDDCYIGLQNKEVAELLKRYDDEVLEECKKRGWI